MDKESTLNSPIQRLHDLINQFSNQYGMACIKCAVIKRDKLYLYLADITILHKNDTPVKEEIQEYDDIILAVIPITLHELNLLVKDLESGQINLKSLGVINAENTLGDRHDFVPSCTYYNGYYYDWPCSCLRASLTNQKSFPEMNNPLVKIGLPSYPSGFEACHAFFQHKDAPTQHTPVCINFLIPDYRARINNLKIDGKSISVSVDNKEQIINNLIVKISCKKRGSGYKHSEDLRPGSDTLEFSTDVIPDEVFGYLLDSVDGKIIDSKIFGPYHQSDCITVSTSSESLNAMIIKGENEHTEFKYDLDKNSNEFLESVVSFANTDGGSILLGVNDEGRIVGSLEDFVKMEKRINGLINNRCEPNIPIKIESVNLEGNPIIVVRVDEGNDKPYIIIGKSAYKRVGKADYAFSRHDFDEIIKKKLDTANMSYRMQRSLYR